MAGQPIRLQALSDTEQLARALATDVPVPMMLALCGPLGAGKTQMVRYLAGELGAPLELVSSPTYVLMQRYRGRIDILHLDFYRLSSAAQVWDLGLDEWLVEPALTIIEWADKFPETWPENYVRCDLQLQADGSRVAQFSAQGKLAEGWLSKLSDE